MIPKERRGAWHGPFRVDASYSRSSHNRPYVHASAIPPMGDCLPEVYVTLAWGNSNSDPVWDVTLHIALPMWADRLLEAHWNWKHRT